MKEAKFSFAKLAAAQAASGARAAAPQALAAVRPAGDRRQLHAQVCACLARIFAAVRERSAFTLEPAATLVRRMAAERPARDELFAAALHLDAVDQFAVHHSVNVAVYAIKMAQDLGFDAERQVQVGLAGLLHDVGIALLPEPLIYKKEPLSAEELNRLRERPNSAARILQCLGPELGFIAECAAQVCERIDGTGYPRGLRAEEIHEYAQIIGLLDLYEALVHSRPNRERLSFFEAVKYICKSCKTQFQRRHLKSLLRVFTVFPLDSYVQLNSEAVGKVVETVPDQPMRPKLQIILDSQRREVLAERVIALNEAPLLNIVRGLAERDVRELRKGAMVPGGAEGATCDTVEAPVL
ncbi:MAG: HD domain-containing protein [Desulfobacterales bacterium]|jgi:HD-GYP domain-containing protein (c-di-GMP phosphodiesterase class II)|nr:HD domain-containing protein [Desulfobacterales bacterium]